jgi:hypothetical protein
MKLPNRIPFVATLDEGDEPADVIDVLGLAPFVAGEQPAACSTYLRRVRPDAPLVPPGTALERVADSDGRYCALAQGDGWTLSSVRWSGGSAHVTVVATTTELAREILAAATEGAVEPAPESDDAVAMEFWHRQCGNARRSSRNIAISTWPDIRRNYSGRASAALEQLMAVTPSDISGRVVLLHGPPGTGKTTVIRALAHAWRGWCRFEVVVDAELLYGDPAYLTAVLLEEADTDDDGVAGWRLLVLEDCDELIRADAKKETGQALARLLNVTDGLIGQGLKVLVAITTNEPLASLHPAVVRPGRCLAEIYIGALSRPEAVAWLGGEHPVGAEGGTLAELYARRGSGSKVHAPELRPVAGTYL